MCKSCKLKQTIDFVNLFHNKFRFFNLEGNPINNFKNVPNNILDFESRLKKLSESFIREFQDKVDWKLISKYQKFNNDFIREFQYSIVYSVLHFNMD